MNSESRDDIDIQELAVRIIRFFLNHLIFISTFCVAGVLLGILAYRAIPNIYGSQMVVLSDLLTKTYGNRMDESLNNLIHEGNFTELSARLSLPAEVASSIRSVSVECELDIKAPQRENVEKDETYFIITVELTDPTAFVQVQDGLLHYLRNNEWVKSRALQRVQLSTAVTKRIDKEIRILDSLKQVLFQRGQLQIEKIHFDPSVLFAETVELTRLRWREQQELELAGSVHLIEGFTAFQQPKDPKLATLLAAGFVLGLIGSIGLLTLRHLISLARG